MGRSRGQVQGVPGRRLLKTVRILSEHPVRASALTPIVAIGH